MFHSVSSQTKEIKSVVRGSEGFFVTVSKDVLGVFSFGCETFLIFCRILKRFPNCVFDMFYFYGGMHWIWIMAEVGGRMEFGWKGIINSLKNARHDVRGHTTTTQKVMLHVGIRPQSALRHTGARQHVLCAHLLMTASPDENLETMRLLDTRGPQRHCVYLLRRDPTRRSSSSQKFWMTTR